MIKPRPRPLPKHRFRQKSAHKGTPSKKLLGHMLQFYGTPLPPKELDLLWTYHQALRTWNTDSDLSRLHSFETIVEKHYVDCLWVPQKMLKNKLPSPLLDIGTGAGFPGIILAIVSPQTKIILAEPRPKRVQFLEHVVKTLDLKNVEIFPHKVTSKSFTKPIAATICRAFASIENTLPRILPALQIHGQAMFMKGPAAKEELQNFASPDFHLNSAKFYTLPHTKHQRSFVVLKKKKVSDHG